MEAKCSLRALLNQNAVSQSVVCCALQNGENFEEKNNFEKIKEAIKQGYTNLKMSHLGHAINPSPT